MSQATGTFEVKLEPAPAEEKSAGTPIARMLLDKQFHGDLEATSKGTMLASRSANGSGAYVALEFVTGKLGGRTGSFLLQHTGIMTKGAPQLTVAVVPDSGSGELDGLSGKMNIIIAEGKHSYEFDYSLPTT